LYPLRNAKTEAKPSTYDDVAGETFFATPTTAIVRECPHHLPAT